MDDLSTHHHAGIDGMENSNSADDNPESDIHGEFDGGLEQHQPSVCILHISGTKNKDSAIKRWNDETWAKVTNAANARRSMKNFQTSPFRSVIEALPPQSTEGYHSTCYKNFTAVSSKKIPTGRAPSSDERPLRSGLKSPVPKSTSGIFPDLCIFCNKQSKTRPDGSKETLGKCETKYAESKILEIAKVLELTDVLVKISGVDLIAKEAKYHHTCRSEKMKAAERLTNSKTEYKKADRGFEVICAYVEESVIINNRPELLDSVYDQYVDLCTEASCSPIGTVKYFGEVLKKRFLDRISVYIPSRGKKSGSIVHSSAIDYDSIRCAYDYKTSPEGIVIKAAIILRQSLKSVQKESLSEPLTLNSLLEGEGSPPELVRSFFRTLIGGLTVKSPESTVDRRADMMSQDALFVVTKGAIMPPKHIRTAIALKSMTGSRKVITMMNRFGHCISYSATEELECELAYAITERQKSLPDGAVPGIPGGLAWDNYDELCHTLSGSDTLHDTMGIYYQCESMVENEMNLPPQTATTHRGEPESTGSTSTGTTLTTAKTRRRKLDIMTRPIEPYRKKPRMEAFQYPNMDVWSLPDSSTIHRRMDLVWMAAHALQLENIPMWTGFNARYYTDHLPKQIVYYMPNIDRSPTNPDVVAETLRITQRCAMESGQKYGIVTYDLDVARTAIKIQSTNQPEYDDVFVLFGAFHIMMCLFRAIGKVINESGGPQMLVDSEVLASGSMKGFIDCTNYSRCKRLHSMLALAFEILHFRKFISQHEERSELIAILSSMSFDDATSMDNIADSIIFDKLFQEYSEYTAFTHAGNLGKTAQFWMQYVSLVNDYRILERSIRTNNVDLFISMLTPVTDLFFATNRPNYARWIAKYQLDLLNLENTHPGLKEMLESGLFTIRRTDNEFSRLPIDLTLEQTVNCDAASRLTGYTASTNSYSARLKWTVTKGSRAVLVAAALEMAGMTNSNDVHTDLSKSRIHRDNSDLGKLLHVIEETADPFSIDSEFLVNISTGKAASPEIEQSLLTIRDEGRRRHQEFNKECSEDSSRFERPIPRNPLKNFASQGAKNRNTQNPALKELRCTRDLFGRIAVIATKTKVDFEYLMTFPLTPVPLTLCKTDGTLVHTDKSALFQHLESKLEDESPHPRDVAAQVIDGNFLLHCLPPLPPTYGGVSRTVLNHIVNTDAPRVHIVFDTYETPWVKDVEHERRGAQDNHYKITGSDQVRPKNFEKALKSNSFKQELPRFFKKDWAAQHHLLILKDKEVYLGVDDTCTRFYVQDGKVLSEKVDRLTCNHPEADTRVCLHVRYVSQMSPGRDVIVRAGDTDIFVVLLCNLGNFGHSEVFMEVGTAARGKRYVNVSAVGRKIGPDICIALPGFHAFTGCDYTAAFSRKGKKKPFELMAGNDKFIKAFGDVGDLSTAEDSEEVLRQMEKYTCALYGSKKNNITLNKHRYQVFEKSYGPPDDQKPLEKMKGVDGSSIPPCEAVIKQKSRRTSFIARMWRNASSNMIPKLPNSGWELDDEGRYKILWFDGEQMPSTVVPRRQDNNDENDEDGDVPRFDFYEFDGDDDSD